MMKLNQLKLPYLPLLRMEKLDRLIQINPLILLAQPDPTPLLIGFPENALLEIGKAPRAS